VAAPVGHGEVAWFIITTLLGFSFG
jgi:hypothetical protein